MLPLQRPTRVLDLGYVDPERLRRTSPEAIGEAVIREESFMLSKPRYRVIGEIERYDERDNVQARGQLEPGSENFIEFYETSS